MKIFSAHKFHIFLKNSEINFPQRGSRWPGVLPLILLPALAMAFSPVLPAWAFMWSLAVAIFAGCKWLSWWDANGPQAPWLRSAAYFALWPGMDARAFLGNLRIPKFAPWGAWAFAVGKILFGVVLLWVVTPKVYPASPLAAGWVGMTGLIFLLHFGLFHLLSLGWQSVGVAALPLMKWPIAAESLGSFWGERWNAGFNDLAVRHVFRPLCPRVGIVSAMLAAFLVSGVVHDLVITVPAGGGYGLPTIYFLIQGIGLLIERSAFGKSLGLRRGLRGWLFTLAVVAVPVGLLFPAAFVERVMRPFFHVLHVL
jgi:alginate O-acetyltransferase complex protein AlgI